MLFDLVPGGLTQVDGTTITLSYSARWLPGGAQLNSETGWLEWTPSHSHAGSYQMPVTLTATYTPADGGDAIETRVTQNIALEVLNANGAPVFDAAETWNILEGQILRISAFAFDPDNPGFEPKVRLRDDTPVEETVTTAPTVTYQVSGLPEGAIFDEETLEIVWTPEYDQSGTYTVTRSEERRVGKECRL